MFNKYILAVAFLGVVITLVGCLIHYNEVKKIEPFFKATVIVEIFVAVFIIIP